MIIVDGRCTHPEGRTVEGKVTAVIVKEHEDEKQRTYGAACQAKGYKFVPFVWTTGGVIGQSAMKLINKLAERLGERWHRPKGRCKGWIKGQIALAIARSTSACIRNVRGSIPQAAYDIPAFDGAAIASGVARF